jgi:DNA-binding NtrC family response regulator
MKQVLIAWVGLQDVEACERDAPAESILADVVTAKGYAFDEVLLLSDFGRARTERLAAWLRKRSNFPLVTRLESLEREGKRNPVDYRLIHDAAVRGVEDARARHGRDCALHFLLNTGTPPMGSVWLLLGKSRYPATLLGRTRHRTLEVIDVPFEISADFAPRILAATEQQLEEIGVGTAPATAAFSRILHRCDEMRRIIDRAGLVAQRDVPALIEGESGTGKELLARAIHQASPRSGKPFVAVNCGAIPEPLIESELFGHVKGAFTGADKDRKGHLREAHGGTLFLDEVGELPLSAQVRLLRPLQEREVVPVGASKAEAVNVRVIAATHRSLRDQVAAGRFREDLYYRLNVAVLRVPPLRARAGDVGYLIERTLEELANGGVPKALEPRARNLLLRHDWPGNVRELRNVLQRATLWSTQPVITAADIEEALSEAVERRTGEVLGRSLGSGFSLEEMLAKVATHYLERAREQSHGNKTEAAALLGFASHQRLSNWLDKYGVHWK